MARSNVAIYSALAANVAIAVAKFIAGGISHSSAMIAEGVHSLVDTVNELLLLYGIARSDKERDERHPFGYGRELYFWSFIVAILIFALGAGVSFYQGIVHLRRPAISEDLGWNYAVLGFSFISEGTSFVIAYRKFRKTIGDRGWWEAVRVSKDPTDFMVLFEDGAAVLGIVVVFVLLLIGEWTKNPYLDGVASVLVGCILTVASGVLARESRSLLIGEGISAKTEGEIRGIVEGVRDGGKGTGAGGADKKGTGEKGSNERGMGDGKATGEKGSNEKGMGDGGKATGEKESGGTKVKRVFSLYQAPDEVLLLLIVDFPSGLSADELSDRIGMIREKIKSRYPKIAYVVIQPE